MNDARDLISFARHAGCDWVLLDKQVEFVQSPTRHTLYSGAFGAGKTRAVCQKVVLRVMAHPGMREGLVRKHNVTLKATTLKTLLQRDGDLLPVLPRGSYTHNKSAQEIKLHGGGEIVYFGIDDPLKVGSRSLTGCGIDEAIELGKDDYTMIDGRCRVDVGINNEIYGACNPAGPSHFLAIKFGIAPGTTIELNHTCVRTNAYDNIFLPASYIEALEQMAGVARRRYLLGEWCGSEGLVFDRFDRSVHLATRGWDDVVAMYVGIDEGYTNPTVLLLITEHADGALHVMREWYQAERTPDEIVDVACEWDQRWPIIAWIHDPSAKGLALSMRKRGLNVKAADNTVFAGIMAVQRELNRRKDGTLGLTIAPTCTNTIREFESYEWMSSAKTGLQDKPRKQYDHAMDALRYLIVQLRGKGTAPRMILDRPQQQERHVETPQAELLIDDDRYWQDMT